MAKKRNLKTSLVMSLFLLAIVSTAGAEIIYVDADASTGGDGQTWGTAYKYLQDALAVASSGEIWVAAGTYKPDPSGPSEDPREATFQLTDGVAIFGGFAGGETSLDERDWETYETVLSGDLNGNDVGDLYDSSRNENSWHVVTSSGTDATAVLDGFTVTAGYASYSGPYPFHGRYGGGMYNAGGSPTVTNCTFSANMAGSGGGMYNSEGNPTVTNCTFSANMAGSGGGMYNSEGNPTVTNCTFSGNNTHGSGGGMFNNYSSPTVTNCTFTNNNEGDGYGGGMGNSNSYPTVTNCTFSGNSAGLGGGMHNRDNSSPTVTNCTFSDNTAWEGGGMGNDEYSSPTVTNCTFSRNSAHYYGAGMYNEDYSDPTLTNCILWGNTAPSGPQIYNDGTSSPAVNYCCVEDWSGGGWGNIDDDPLFVDPPDNLRLSTGSPCIDAGDNASLPADSADLDGDGDTGEAIPFDLAGNPRIFNDIVDMGAYECQVEQPPEVDGVIGSAGGTVEDTDGTGASFSVDSGVLPEDTSISIEVLPDPGVDSPPGFAATGTYFVVITLDPNPSPLPPPGATITLPLVPVAIPLPEGTTLSLFKFNPDTGEFIDTEIVGTVDPGSTTATFTGVTEFSIFAGFQDVAPPEIISISASPDELWPPNHKMVEVTVEVDAEDNSDPAPVCWILGVDSNEFINGPGDGNTEPDWDYTDDPLVVLLRAERAGGGTGRVYTILVDCRDTSGNIATGTVDVIVPHDQGKGKKKGKK